MIMKKMLLGLGAITSVGITIPLVVSCSEKQEPHKEYRLAKETRVHTMAELVKKRTGYFTDKQELKNWLKERNIKVVRNFLNQDGTRNWGILGVDKFTGHQTLWRRDRNKEYITDKGAWITFGVFNPYGSPVKVLYQSFRYYEVLGKKYLVDGYLPLRETSTNIVDGEVVYSYPHTKKQFDDRLNKAIEEIKKI